MDRNHARVLVALHAELVTEADKLRRGHDRREGPAAEMLWDQAAEAILRAKAIAAMLAASGADVESPPEGQLSLLSLGEPV